MFHFQSHRMVCTVQSCSVKRQTTFCFRTVAKVPGWNFS